LFENVKSFNLVQHKFQCLDQEKLLTNELILMRYYCKWWWWYIEHSERFFLCL